MRATDTILSPIADASGGSVHWLSDGIPAGRATLAAGPVAAAALVGCVLLGAIRR